MPSTSRFQVAAIFGTGEPESEDRFVLNVRRRTPIGPRPVLSGATEAASPSIRGDGPTERVGPRRGDAGRATSPGPWATYLADLLTPIAASGNAGMLIRTGPSSDNVASFEIPIMSRSFGEPWRRR